MHVVTQPIEATPIAGTGLVIHGVPLGVDNLGWLAVAPDGTALAVDGPEAGPLLARCEALGVRLVAVLNTHAHGDHVGLNRDLLALGLRPQLRFIGPAELAAVIPGLSEALTDGDRFTFGGGTFEALATPGHVDGHQAFLVGDALFSGDALFTGGCGRMFAGPPAVMQRSLARLRALPGAVRVFCAHEYTRDNLAFARTLEPDNAALQGRFEAVSRLRAAGFCTVPAPLSLERATNPFLRWDSPELLASLHALKPEEPLKTPCDIFHATRRMKDTWRPAPS
jgi:hydroxyacylglutathione hydrolase